MPEGKTHKKIAIIGSGISGLSAAYMLRNHHDITIYEKNDYIGGHSRTVDIAIESENVPVDTGFIVFNYRNYPFLVSLFEHLDVPVCKSDMSFGASIKNGWLEYGTQYISNIFAQKSNLLRPAFWRMIFDIFKFNRNAHKYIDAPPSVTLGKCVDELGMGRWFREYFLLAIGGSIWSTPLDKMLEFPACTFVRFFDNHGLLSVSGQPQWYTVKGGSKEYVKRISADFKENILLNTAVKKIVRRKDNVEIYDENNNVNQFDEVVFACHADQAIKMIEDPADDEREILESFSYQPNRMLLHSDQSFMPNRKNAWASWVYLSEEKEDRNDNVCLSYWMNNLQPLNTEIPIIVTLNPKREPDKSKIYDEYWFEHPVFDGAAISAQSRISEIQGADRFWFCGAYQRYGFHEDGLLSAVNMADKMGIKPDWK